MRLKFNISNEFFLPSFCRVLCVLAILLCCVLCNPRILIRFLRGISSSSLYLQQSMWLLLCLSIFLFISLCVYRNRRGVWNLSSRSNRVHPFHLSAKNIDSQCLRAIVYSCNVRSFINIKIIDIIDDGTG